MLKYLTTACIVFLSLLSYAQHTVNIGSINSLSVSTNVDATLHESNEDKVVYTVIKGDKDDVVIKVDNGRLKIKIDNGILWTNNTKIKADIYTRNLSEISVSAGARLTSEGVFNAKSMSASASSGASVNLEINALNLDADCSSGASITLEGMADKVSVETSSGSSAMLHQLKAKHVVVDASSGSSTSVHAMESITAEASSGASITYAGNPAKKDIDTSSGGSVSSRN